MKQPAAYLKHISQSNIHTQSIICDCLLYVWGRRVISIDNRIGTLFMFNMESLRLDSSDLWMFQVFSYWPYLAGYTLCYPYCAGVLHRAINTAPWCWYSAFERLLVYNVIYVYIAQFGNDLRIEFSILCVPISSSKVQTDWQQWANEKKSNQSSTSSEIGNKWCFCITRTCQFIIQTEWFSCLMVLSDGFAAPFVLPM